MKCHFCGYESSKETKFCRKCGNQITVEENQNNNINMDSVSKNEVKLIEGVEEKGNVIKLKEEIDRDKELLINYDIRIRVLIKEKENILLNNEKKIKKYLKNKKTLENNLEFYKKIYFKQFIQDKCESKYNISQNSLIDKKIIKAVGIPIFFMWDKIINSIFFRVLWPSFPIKILNYLHLFILSLLLGIIIPKLTICILASITMVLGVNQFYNYIHFCHDAKYYSIIDQDIITDFQNDKIEKYDLEIEQITNDIKTIQERLKGFELNLESEITTNE